MTNFNKVQWNDRDPAHAQFQGFELLRKLGIPKDMMIESANIDLLAGHVIKLHATFILSVAQLKEMGVDLNA